MADKLMFRGKPTRLMPQDAIVFDFSRRMLSFERQGPGSIEGSIINSRGKNEYSFPWLNDKVTLLAIAEVIADASGRSVGSTAEEERGKRFRVFLR